MSKSVYSIVLTDEVVEAVDRLAYQRGTSRSNMIDRILAESVSFMTPQQRMRQVFNEIEQMLTPTGNFQLLMQPSDSMMSLRSALRYKYNPTVRYSVEMVRAGEDQQIRLKVILRTQSRTLIEYMDRFFILWNKLEKQAEEKRSKAEEKKPAHGGANEAKPETDYGWKTETDAAKYYRVLHAPSEDVSDEEFGERIAVYIRAVDEAMKTFFGEIEDPERAVEDVALHFAKYQQSIDYEL